jgi:hypothetical protein
VQTKITNSFQTPAIEISEEKAKELPAFDLDPRLYQPSGSRYLDFYRNQHEASAFHYVRNFHGSHGYFAWQIVHGVEKVPYTVLQVW